MTEPYTKTELRILEILSDGQWHHKSEITARIDEYMSRGALSVHMANIRKKMNGSGQALICGFIGVGTRTGYRLVRLLTSPVDGTN